MLSARSAKVSHLGVLRCDGAIGVLRSSLILRVTGQVSTGLCEVDRTGDSRGRDRRSGQVRWRLDEGLRGRDLLLDVTVIEAATSDERRALGDGQTGPLEVSASDSCEGLSSGVLL